MRHLCFHTGVLIVLLGVLGGCETVITEPNNLDSFEVRLSKGKPFDPGTADKPAPYISGTSCADTECPGQEECIGYCSLTGVPCGVDEDCGQDDYCVKICASPVWVDIQALGRDGKPVELREDRYVQLSVQPGFVPPPYRNALLKSGKAARVQVYIAQAVGESRIWVEDTGEGPVDGLYGECNNEVDDDGDGGIDLGDPDCTGPGDPTESHATYATGLSEKIYFETPRIWHIQYTDQVSTSPLEGQNVQVNRGDLVVTNVISNGFYITDLRDNKDVLDDGLPGFYNSFFFYTFSKPEGIYYGDVLCGFSGGIVEHEGNTQMTFPTYEAYGNDGCQFRNDAKAKLDVPDPVDITERLVAEDPSSTDYKDQLMSNSRVLEPFESSLVVIRNASVSTRYIACDSDEDGEYPSGSDDDLCRDECQKDPYCTQLESYFKYSQLAAFANMEQDSGMKFYIALDMLKEKSPLTVAYIGAKDTSGNCPDVLDSVTGEVSLPNPHTVAIGNSFYTEYSCPDMNLDSVTGNLRQIYLCPKKPGKKESCSLQMHMLVPRFDDDFDVVD